MLNSKMDTNTVFLSSEMLDLILYRKNISVELRDICQQYYFVTLEIPDSFLVLRDYVSEWCDNRYEMKPI